MKNLEILNEDSVRQISIINQVGNIVIGYCRLNQPGPLIIEYNGLYLYRVVFQPHEIYLNKCFPSKEITLK